MTTIEILQQAKALLTPEKWAHAPGRYQICAADAIDEIEQGEKPFPSPARNALCNALDCGTHVYALAD